MRRWAPIGLAVASLVVAVSCLFARLPGLPGNAEISRPTLLFPPARSHASTSVLPTPPSPCPSASAERNSAARLIIEGARQDIGSVYDPGYVDLPYPHGDLPAGRGACTDVVIRALRNAGHDLQLLIHEDVRARPSAYPLHRWSQTAPDPNIDHRRIPNQMAFFRRHGISLTLDPGEQDDWRPGDLVYWRLGSGLLHTGVLSDRQGADGLPLAIHNLSVCVEEDALTRWQIIGHYRYPP